jgi:serine/threonine protein kinase
MSISLDEFVRSLTDTGILPPEELTSLVTSFSEDRAGVDVERLAKELVRQQKLTRFQASVIFRRQSRGLRFGDYIVLDKLGSGGMGQVFKAENRQTGQIVAIKLLRATYTKSQKAVARFYRESETAMRLRHPNLVAVHEAGEWNGLHFLVMELIDGRDVRSIIKEQGPLSVSSAVGVLLQAGRGLAHAHEKGIVHRDIKPANLLLEKGGRIVVLDLGLARQEESDQEGEGDDAGRLTMPGTFLGTLEYVAPEQAVDAHDVDGRCDIYSLGCSLHYLLRGRPPFRRENAAQTLLAHCHDPIPNLRGEVSGIPERLARLFERMLAKNPVERIATMSEVVAELEACQRELDGAAAAPVAAGKAAPVESKSVTSVPVTTSGTFVEPSGTPTAESAPRTAPSTPQEPESAADSADKSSDSVGIATDDTSLSEAGSSRLARALSTATSTVRGRVSAARSAAGRLLKRFWVR